jgi:hypothetical protein
MSFKSNLRQARARFGVYFLFCSFFISIQAISSAAFAWGHIIYFNDPDLAAVHLVFPALKSHRISYCLAIDSAVANRFEETSIEAQINSVIQIWLRPVQDHGLIGRVQILRTPCSENTFDLKIAIGPELKYPSLGSYQLESLEKDHKFTLIKINSNFQWDSVSVVDFKALVGPSKFTSVLSRLQQTDAVSPDQFGMDNGLDYYTLFWSTQRILLHEMGHSFGLCDTIPSQVSLHCDPNHLTQQFKLSVMSDSNFLSLTNDDIDGIVSVFNRFASR